ncbi:MAG: acylphosphatase [Candidatus Anstonellales archaeon]
MDPMNLNLNEHILCFRVYGRVQGVFYRATCKDIAKKLNLRGYVKNLDDGSVEIGCYGTKEDVDKLIEWAKIGPKNARVERLEFVNIDSKRISYIKSFNDFVITG